MAEHKDEAEGNMQVLSSGTLPKFACPWIGSFVLASWELLGRALSARPGVLLSRQRTRVRTAHNRAEAFAPPSRKATFPAPVIPGGPPVSPFVAYSNPHVGTNLQG